MMKQFVMDTQLIFPVFYLSNSLYFYNHAYRLGNRISEGQTTLCTAVATEADGVFCSSCITQDFLSIVFSTQKD